MMEHNALKMIRAFHRLSQTQLAEKIGLSKSYISEVESGKKEVTHNILNEYSKTFNIPKSSILLLSEALDGDKKLPKPASKIVSILNFIVEGDQNERDQESLCGNHKPKSNECVNY